MDNSYIYIYHVNVTQTVPDISPLMPMHQDPLLVYEESLLDQNRNSCKFQSHVAEKVDWEPNIILAYL